LLSVTTSLRRYGTAEGSISHLSRLDIERQLGLQMRAVRRARKVDSFKGTAPGDKLQPTFGSEYRTPRSDKADGRHTEAGRDRPFS
jgi:hypothetical protein